MAQTIATQPGQYVTFTLGKEIFAVEIDKIREILEFSAVTQVPQTPAFMRGVINLRGNVVPVVDLKLKFGMERTDRTVDTCTIILEVQVDGEQTVLGALADSVQEVIDLDPKDIEPPPRMGTRLDTAFIRGMGKRKDDFLIILDVDRVFTFDEMKKVHHDTALVPPEDGPAANGTSANV